MLETCCGNCAHYRPRSAECHRLPPTPVPSLFLIQWNPTASTFPGMPVTASLQLQTTVGQWPKLPASAECGEFSPARDLDVIHVTSEVRSDE